MKISNVRLGFATNSSSVHSIVFGLDKKIYIDYNDVEYGWDEWCATSESSKKSYLAVLLYTEIADKLGDDIAKMVVKEWTGIDNDIPFWEGYIDHQSFMGLPLDQKTGQVSKDFFTELLNYYLRNDISIIGGNDNMSNTEYSFPKSIRHPHKIPTGVGSNGTCRKDGEWWTLFNPKTGAKFRLSFNDLALPYLKSTSPELVDVKITDYCTKGCNFCYQNSSRNGKHSDRDVICDITSSLRDMNVFEVSFGGGEPTSHPDFAYILSETRRKGMVPNFSTATLDWLDDYKMVDAVKKNVGGFGVTVSDGNDISNAIKKLYRIGLGQESTPRLSFHYVMGSVTLDFLDEILGIAGNLGHPVTLLGFKQVGRGVKYRPYDYSKWLDIVKKHPYTSVGIDTSLAMTTDVDDLPKLLVSYKEGKFSMAIDAVNKTMSPSSYSDIVVPLLDSNGRCTKEDMVRKYAKW